MSLYIFDLDGVIYRGERLLSGAKESLDLLRERGEKVCFLSNNSTLSRRGYLRKLTRLGIRVSLEELFPSSYLAAVYFNRDRRREKSRLFVIGEEGLFEELREAGVRIVQE
ncbi:MAG TPA: HAD family hydrolase, partial [Candidatus Aerophobetes bacterium]|nr:HAD family hydrolase [Candidatus Aerophobetes bacterium]